jgi:hypothetical protein
MMRAKKHNIRRRRKIVLASEAVYWPYFLLFFDLLVWQLPQWLYETGTPGIACYSLCLVLVSFHAHIRTSYFTQ